MAITRNFDTGTSGGGGVPNPAKLLDQLAGSGGWGSVGAKTAQQSGSLTAKAASSSGGNTVSSSNWTCPEGADLVRESTGSGNLVCRWRHNGAEFPAMSARGGGGSSSGGGTSVGGGSSSGGGSGSGAGSAAGGSTTGGGGSSAGTTGSGEYLQAAADIYARNPEAMLADMLERQHGEYNGNALYAQLQPYADAMNVLFLLNNGQDADSGSKDNFLNYAQDYWNTLQTPGGRLNYEGMLNNLHNPAEGSPLHSYLSTGNSEDQASNYLRLMAGVMQTGFHPLIAQAVMDRLGLEADRYIGASGRMAADPFYTRLDARIPGLPRLVPGR